MAALDAARRERPSVGDARIFATPGKTHEPPSRHLFRDWRERMERVAGLGHVSGRGWHSLRRQFATELKHTPLRDLCHLGGWKDPQTVLKCYQKADEITMRAALETRARLRPDGLQAQRRSARSARIDTMNRHHESTPWPAFRKTKRPARGRNLKRGVMFVRMGLRGVEPRTSRLSGVRSNHLSYRPLATGVTALWRRALQVSRAPWDGQSAERGDRDETVMLFSRSRHAPG